MAEELTSLVKKVAVHETQICENRRRITSVESTLMMYQELLVEVREIKVGVSHLSGQVNDLSQRVTNHELEPAGKWEKLKWAVLMILVSAVLALLLTHLGLG